MKKILFIAVLSFGFMANAMAQHFDDEEEVVEKKVVEKKVEEKKVEVIEQSESDEVFEVVDKMPSFPGGQGAMFDFMARNIQYPKVAEENGVQGCVIVTFIVKKDGSLSYVRIVKSVDPALDKEALRLIKSMPKWSPGINKGKYVNVKFTVPVTFRLQ